jgi:hypothetical protein
MARRFLVPINISPLSSDPVSGTEGDSYFNTSTNKVRVYYDGAWNDLSGSTSSASNSFETINTPSGTDPVADSSTDTLNLTASNGMVVTGDSSTDTIDFSTNATSLNTASTIVSRDADQAFDITAIDFDTTDSITSAVGRLTWDDGEGTLNFGLKGGNINLQIGQENIALCYNGTGSTITKGSVVYISGVQGQRPSLALADADSESTSSKTFGVVAENISNGSEGFVCTFGIIENIDTSQFTAGQTLWLSSTAGQLTNTKPTPPVHTVFMGYCLKSNSSSGRIFINPQNGYELDEIHDVSISTPLTGHTIVYNSNLDLWQNKSIINEVIPNQQYQENKFLTTNGENLSWGTIPFQTAQVEDTVGNMVSNNTESGLSVDFNNVTRKLNFSITDSHLSSISALNNVANTIFYFNGTAPNVFSTTTLTEHGRSIISSVDSAAARTVLGLSNVENTALSTFTGNSFITSVGTITSGTWNGAPITGSYIDSSIARLNSPTFIGNVSLPSTTSIGDVSSVEIGYLDGVTSSIQTQLNAKASSLDLSTLQTQVNGKLDSLVASTTYAPLNSPTFTGTVTLTSATVVGLVGVPSQTSHSGKYLTTNGTNPSWSAINVLKYSATAPESPSAGDIWVESDVDVTGLDPHHYVRWTRVLTGSQSSFSGISSAGVLLEYTPGREQVYLNGVLLLRGTDYTATDGLTVVLLTAASSGAVFEVIALNVLNVANTYTSSQIDTSLALKANIASPTFTGVPAAPTATSGTNTTQIATTAFVNTEISTKLDKIISSNAQTGTSYTLVLADATKFVEMNNSSANTVTVPPNSSVAFPVGSRIDIVQTGSGQTTIQAGVGVTVNSFDSGTKLSGQWAGASLIKRAENTWVLIGNITT